MPHPMLSAIEKFSELALEQAQTVEQRSALIAALEQFRAFGKALEVEGKEEEKFSRDVKDWYHATLKTLCLFSLVIKYDPAKVMEDFSAEMMAMYVWIGKMVQAVEGKGPIQ